MPDGGFNTCSHTCEAELTGNRIQSNNPRGTSEESDVEVLSSLALKRAFKMGSVHDIIQAYEFGTIFLINLRLPV